MPENNIVTKAMRRDNSLTRYSIRYDKDACLHNYVEYFMSKRGASLARLVDKLVSNELVLARYTDPIYPA